MLRLAAVLLSLTLLSFTQGPQPQAPSPEMQAANQLMQQKKFAEAAQAYEAIVAKQPNHGFAWNQLGMARMGLQQYPAAGEAFQKSFDTGKSPFALYNLACAQARAGQKSLAIETLNKAFAAGLPTSVSPEQDDDLASLREEAAFKTMLADLDKKKRPCMYTAESRQFDFFVGEWTAFNPQGQQAGTSKIEQVAEGCGVLENWTNRGGTTGKSLNFYDPVTKKWHQYWIGPTGSATRYTGTFSDGALRYEAEPTVQNGQKRLGRLTFFHVDANTVRQLAEFSVDEGKTWQTGYDFKYVRKNATMAK